MKKGICQYLYKDQNIRYIYFLHDFKPVWLFSGVIENVSLNFIETIGTNLMKNYNNDKNDLISN